MICGVSSDVYAMTWLFLGFMVGIVLCLFLAEKESKKKQVTIQELLPFMKPGYVAMDKDGTWCWFSEEPFALTRAWLWENNSGYFILSKTFNIAPFEGDWKDSLIKIVQ